ncbi:MAG: hypothetical protein AAF513_17995 [Pseudomonadota bacterium]
MQLIDPTVSLATDAKVRAPALTDLAGKTIGLLSNNKVNADVLLTLTADLFVGKYGGKVAKMRYKTNASAPAPAETLTNLSHEVDYLITAAGD